MVIHAVPFQSRDTAQQAGADKHLVTYPLIHRRRESMSGVTHSAFGMRRRYRAYTYCAPRPSVTPMTNTDGPRMCGGIDESRARRAALSSTRTSLSEEPSFFTSLTFLDDGGVADVFDDELELHGNQEDMLWALTIEVKMVVNGHTAKT